MNKEKIVASAFNCAGLIIAVTKPQSHGQIISLCSRYGFPASVLQSDQGFITSNGRFVGRKEAQIIAFDAGQISFAAGFKDGLSSEDLWKGM